MLGCGGRKGCGKRYERRCMKVSWDVGEIRGDVGKGEGREMWGIKSVLGLHTSTHFRTSSSLPSPHPFPTRQHTSPLAPYTFPHPPHTSPLPTHLSLLPPTPPHISSHSSSDLPLHPNTLPYSPHALSHTFLPTSYPTVSLMWRSYQVTRKAR